MTTTPAKDALPMKDVQNDKATIALPIDKVGVKGVRLPLVVRDKQQGKQHTVASVDLSVELPAEFKGTHMSRFVEALESWTGELDYTTHRHLLADVCDRLQARAAHISFRFPYFVEQRSPASGRRGLMSYDCVVDGVLEDDKLTLTAGVDVPVMTVCPCSLAISDEGAHSQRAMVRLAVRFHKFVWLEELVEIAEKSASCAVYTLLKRNDEKHVTETAFANPTFVEDVVRNAAKQLIDHDDVTWFRAEVESFESIHNHNAVAAIEYSKE